MHEYSLERLATLLDTGHDFCREVEKRKEGRDFVDIVSNCGSHDRSWPRLGPVDSSKPKKDPHVAICALNAGSISVTLTGSHPQMVDRRDELELICLGPARYMELEAVVVWYWLE